MTRSGSAVSILRQDLGGIATVLLSALLIGMAPNAAKIAYEEGAGLSAVICGRILIGTLGIALYLSLRRTWPRPWHDPLGRSVGAGFAQALTTVGFIGAVAYLDVSLAALVFYLHPFLVAVAGHFRGDMRITPVLIGCIAAAVVGIALVLGVTFATVSLLGLGLSVVGMVAAAVMILQVSDISREVGPIPANFYMSVWATIFLFAAEIAGQAGWDEPIALPTSFLGWIAVAGAGVTTTTGYVLFFVGARLLGVTRAVVWSVTEPLFAILFAIVLINESLTTLQWIGATILILSLLRFEGASRG